MRKAFLLICVLLTLLLACTRVLPAQAAGAVLSFPKTSASVTGGFPFRLTLRVSPAAAQDTAVPLLCSETGERWTLTIPAGEAEGTLEIATSPVDKPVTRTIRAASDEDWKAPSKAFSLKVMPLPRTEFYSSVNFGYAGKTATVNIRFENPAYVLKGSTFQLRDQDGNVLSEKTWDSGKGLRAFKVEVTPEIASRRVLSVWMGEYKISAQDGYGAFTDMSRHAVRTVPTDQPWVAVTLDCGWFGQQMPLILPILEKNNVHSTFFMTGYFIRTFTEEARAAVAAGHEVGNHTNVHPKMAAQKKTINRLSQLTVPNRDAVELLGVRPRLFRPPYGDYDREVMALSRAEGMEIIIWTVDSHDWDSKYDYDKIWKRVTKEIKPGDILLFHLDGKHTPAILEKLIPYIQGELGYKCVTVGELLESAGMELPPIVE